MQIGSGFANALNLQCHTYHSNRFRFCKCFEFVDMNMFDDLKYHNLYHVQERKSDLTMPIKVVTIMTTKYSLKFRKKQKLEPKY
jgi:hypothetical protein